MPGTWPLITTTVRSTSLKQPSIQTRKQTSRLGQAGLLPPYPPVQLQASQSAPPQASLSSQASYFFSSGANAEPSANAKKQSEPRTAPPASAAQRSMTKSCPCNRDKNTSNLRQAWPKFMATRPPISSRLSSMLALRQEAIRMSDMSWKADRSRGRALVSRRCDQITIDCLRILRPLALRVH